MWDLPGAAGFPQIKTPVEPIRMVSGGPTYVHISPITAAGIEQIITVGALAAIIGPPTCGIGGVSGIAIGQTCISPILAAGFPIDRLKFY